MELWQWHCRIPFHFSQFQKFFFTSYFGNVIATIAKNFIPSISAMPLPQTIFFFLPFSAMALPQLPNFFFHHLVFLARTHTSSTHPGSRYGQKELQQYYCRKSKIYLSYFLSFSLQLLLNFGNGIAVIHSLSRLLNKLKQYL